MRKKLITAVALAFMAATAFGAVQVAAQDSRLVCIPPAVVQALS